MATDRNSALTTYINAVNNHNSVLERLKSLRSQLLLQSKIAQKADSDVRALNSVGHIVGEILRQVSPSKFIVKSSQGPRYIVGIKQTALTKLENETKEAQKKMNLDDDINSKNLVCTGMRVTLDVTTLTIMNILPREINPVIYKMSKEDPGSINFQEIGGLQDQVRELKEVVELPLKNPEIFKRVGILPPKGVLLYGPPGTGKTLLARALASTLDVSFLKIVASSIIEKYIGESARMIREMFQYARDRQPCIIFIDEIDAIGGKRSSESTSSDREVQRTLMELLAQMDGFSQLDTVKIIMATNRPDILDEALLRPGRLDRKVEIPLPTDKARKEIFGIHSKKMKSEGLDDNLMKSLVALSDGFNGADIRNVCTEAGMCAVRDERDFVKGDDFIRAVRKIGETKKLESKMHYKKQ
ncbi:26S protease regulatory subunit 10B [Binucleata daphniae]